RHVRRHAHGDARGAVDEQVGERRGQDGRLREGAVVVGDEVDDVLIEARDHAHRGLRQAGLRVAGRGRAIGQAAEVAVPVDQRQAQVEALCQADEGVVDRGVAGRVQLAHDVAHDAGGLHVAAVGTQPHLAHLVDDAPLDGLEAVAGVRQGARIDDGVRVLQERRLHLLGDVDVCDVTCRVRCHDGAGTPSARAPSIVSADPRGDGEDAGARVPVRWRTSTRTPHRAPTALTRSRSAVAGATGRASPRTGPPTAMAVSGSMTVRPASTEAADPLAYAVWTSQIPATEAGASPARTVQVTGSRPSPVSSREATTWAPEATQPKRTAATATRAA